MTKVFLDTNLIIYANDVREPAKETIARELIARAISERSGVVSTQVLQEYAAVALRKLHQDHDVVSRVILFLESLEVIVMTPALIRRSLEIQARYRIDFWDASILAAAESANCSRLLSEDLNPGQLYAGVRVENPFMQV
jgi:predicted nucleic acid-binding protein